ncbi:MAG: type I CRISPR-associated protein Cas7 [Cetobacterium sp.]
MKKRVYGIIGIKSVMANWNADFTGYPKTTSDGNVFGSDKALKYPMKKMWENNGEKVLYIKSYKVDKEKDAEKLRPRNLKERYEKIFSVEDLKKEKDVKNILKNLFSATDVKNFGATFAEEGNNLSITGAVQITQGFNKYDGSISEEQVILSPFRNSKNSDDNNSTLGTKIVSNEAHYIYHFSINPLAYREFEEIGVTDGYTESDYLKFKEVATVSATSFNTNSKVGCENELAVFIETEENQYLPDLGRLVKFEKNENGKDKFVLEFSELLNSLSDKIISIEVYYNPYTTEIEKTIEGTKYYNIFTKKEV